MGREPARKERRARALAARAAQPGTSSHALWNWIERFQEAQERARRHADPSLGAVQTPEPVARLMAQRLLRFPRHVDVRLLDAGCGAGRLLVAALRRGVERSIHLRCLGVEVDGAAKRGAQELEGALRSAGTAHLRTWQILQDDFLLTQGLQGPFDAVIANPPYVPARALPEAYRRRLRRSYPGASRADLSALFVERMLDLLGPMGRLCVIVPNKLLAADYAAPLRRRLFEETEVEEIWDLTGSGVFPGCAAYPVILVACRRRPRPTHEVRLFRADGSLRAQWGQRALLDLPQHVVPMELPGEALSLLQRLLQGRALGDVVSVGCGIATSGFHRAVGYGKERIICSGDIQPFQVDGRRRFDPEQISLAAQSRRRQMVPKVVIPGMFQRLHAAFDAEGDLLGRVYFVPVQPQGARQRVLLLALLNSRLYDVLYRGLFGAVAQSGGYLRLNAPYLRRLPWPAGEFTSSLGELVQRLETGPVTAALRARLNREVEALFGLTPWERRLLSRLETHRRLENGARPRTARKLPGSSAAESGTMTPQST